MGFRIVMEEEGGIKAVVDGDVDLAAAKAIGVDDESAAGAVALGEVAVQEIDPVLLGGITAGGGVSEKISLAARLASICCCTRKKA